MTRIELDKGWHAELEINENGYAVNFTLFCMLMGAGEAEPEAEGGVKWDGCVNWNSMERYTLHACDEEDFTKLANRLIEIRRAARGMMPTAIY